MPQPISAPALAIDWLLRETGSLADPADLLAALCGRLAALGLPLWRATFHLPQLHPQLRSAMHPCRSDTGTVETRALSQRLPRFVAFLHRPLRLITPTAPAAPPRLGGGGTAGGR